MDKLFAYIEKLTKNNLDVKFVLNLKKDKVVLKSLYYVFVLEKGEKNYRLFYKWKLGIIGKMIFRKRFEDMSYFHNSIMNYAEKNNSQIVEINKNS